MEILYYILGHSLVLFVARFSGSPDMHVQYMETLGMTTTFMMEKKRSGISTIKTSSHIFAIPWTRKWLLDDDELIQDRSRRTSETKHSGQFSAYPGQTVLFSVYTKLNRIHFLITKDFPVSCNHCE